VDWAILQNRFDPVPTSAVLQVRPEPSAYDGQRVRGAVRERGIRTVDTTAVYFPPAENTAHPDMHPRDQHGVAMEPYDAYVGLSPHDDDYLARRAELLERVTGTFKPDGVFLSFIRCPGFWESWTNVVNRADVPEYSFAVGALERFELEKG